MMVLRQEVLGSGVDVRNPRREGILKVIDYLADAEAEFKSPEAVAANRERRLKWAVEARK